MRDYMLRVKVGEEDVVAIKERAKGASKTMSEYIRLQARKRAVESCEALAGDEDADAIRQAGRLLKGVLNGTEKADVIRNVERTLEDLCRGH